MKADPEVEPFFVGARRGIERDVLPTGWSGAFELLDLHPLYRSRPWENWKTIGGAMSAWRESAGGVAADAGLRRRGTGGYASGLALAYAASHDIPIVLQEQNTFPGLTTRFFSRFARRSISDFPKRADNLSRRRRPQCSTPEIQSSPRRQIAFREGASARQMGIPASGGGVLLVYGGSQGSQAINDVVAAWIDEGLPPDLFVIWATGKANYDDLARHESPRVQSEGVHCSDLRGVSRSGFRAHAGRRDGNGRAVRVGNSRDPGSASDCRRRSSDR